MSTYEKDEKYLQRYFFKNFDSPLCDGILANVLYINMKKQHLCDP